MIMQTVDEQIELGKHVMATAEVIGTVLSNTAARMIVEDLEKYSFLDCAEALRKCRAEVRGRLTLSDVVNRINAYDGRPNKDEAWNIALQSSDERETVVLTPEISIALKGAKAILDHGDKVAARMAFTSTYERLLITARAQGEPVKWSVSFGWDGDLRAQALETAVQLQRLLPSQAAEMLQVAAPITADGRAIAELLIGPSTRGLLALTHDPKTRNALLSEETVATREASTEVKTRLHQLKLDMIAHAEKKAKERRQLQEAQRRDLQQRKDKAIKMAEEYQARVSKNEVDREADRQGAGAKDVQP
jgi:hypothetical protein